jgi:eukaryotic-like serine/threonine-protein kinase
MRCEASNLLRQLWKMTALSEDRQDFLSVREAIPRISRNGLSRLQQSDPEGLRKMLLTFAAYVADGSSWDFDFCDVIADFMERSVLVTRDPDVMSAALTALVELGEGHNRWHVQDVVLDIVKRVRTDADALAAIDGLSRARPSALDWTISDLALRSLHPVLRHGIERILSR